jgi:two-component system, NarL family, nitrate/nitrite response regulator NarL
VTDRIRVLVADDHAPTRRDIRRIFDGDERFEVCAEAADAVDAVNAAVSNQPDVCLLDIRMPGSGIAAAWEISARLPHAKLVMVTVSRDDRDLFAALRAGAAGYVLKEDPASVLVDAVATVVRGDGVLPPGLTARVIQEFRSREPRRRVVVGARSEPALTSREWEVLDLLRLGLSTAEIARKLFVSQGTIRSHVAAILRKLRAPDRSTAIRMFEHR